MNRASYEFLSLAAILAAGVGLSLTATYSPQRFPEIGGWVAFLGYLLTILIVVGILRPRMPRTAGFMSLLAGVILLALAVGVELVSSLGAPFPRFASAPDLSLLFHATGAVGLGLGLAISTRGFKARASRTPGEENAAHEKMSALENKVRVQAERLHGLLNTDNLTGVFNREVFLERLEEVALRDSRLEKPFGFLLADIAAFREFNKKHGRLVGDDALKQVAQALQGATRGTDYVGRVGDDEFAVVLGECADPRPAINRIFLTLAEGPTYGEAEETIKIRVGTVTVTDAEYGFDFSELFRLAQQAMDSVSASTGSVCAHRSLRPARPRSA